MIKSRFPESEAEAELDGARARIWRMWVNGQTPTGCQNGTIWRSSRHRPAINPPADTRANGALTQFSGRRGNPEEACMSDERLQGRGWRGPAPALISRGRDVRRGPAGTPRLATGLGLALAAGGRGPPR